MDGTEGWAGGGEEWLGEAVSGATWMEELAGCRVVWMEEMNPSSEASDASSSPWSSGSGSSVQTGSAAACS